MTEMRRYIDLLNESTVNETKTKTNPLAETARVRKMLGLKEGELIPLPMYVIRVPGAPYDFYQLMKMSANPNLAHKINYKPTGSGKAGANVTDITIVFYDKASYENTKKMFDYFKVDYTDEPELSSEMGRQAKKPPFKSPTNPPSEQEAPFMDYLKPEDHPV